MWEEAGELRGNPQGQEPELRMESESCYVLEEIIIIIIFTK